MRIEIEKALIKLTKLDIADFFTNLAEADSAYLLDKLEAAHPDLPSVRGIISDIFWQDNELIIITHPE